ncbi:Two-component response regulator ARR18 [Acorus gramineus]|uniref:Two-component response regulator ARR18 n=1 Tax=Acorus gramineus TaxID=55184 RepID=A0AAV9AY86_ACOGR|nr:Two-component response regulator ARR18 [Acorus gramineus]
MDFPERTRKCQEYMDALEQERKKIEVFQRELPLCLQLVTHAIESCKQQLGATEVTTPYGRSDGEETSSEGPVLEEFMPIKCGTTSETTEEGEVEKQRTTDEKKPDWLRSVQLWNPDPVAVKEAPRKPCAIEVKKTGGGAFVPFHGGEKRPPAVVVPATAASTNSETEGQSSHRKARRCWSPELHRRFLHALQQLGGSLTATPKQIRELMKVDGLTNDEVKSHLQKYRLHTRRPSPGTAVQSDGNGGGCQPPQFVLVGGIWVPPPEYAAAAAAAAKQAMDVSSAGRLYAPVATLPAERKKRMRSSAGDAEGRGSRNEHCLADDETNSNSENCAASSSSQTTTASPPPAQHQ